ncbi:MAG: hypothetical protein LLG04_06750 [Parachlamydia sp.]|nr:hypothetical protein [Parachlamydia sp.]
MFLAERIGCPVTGITFSEKQVQTATAKSARGNCRSPPLLWCAIIPGRISRWFLQCGVGD